MTEGSGEAQGQAQAQVSWQWLSPRSLIVRPVTDLIRLLPVLVGVLFFGHGSGNYWGLSFAVLAIVTSVVRWCTTRYQITSERVYLRRGLLNQKVLSVPRDRIRSVDLSAHVVYRLLGLRRVMVGTGRNDRREGESIHLDALTLTDAEALRASLLAGAGLAGAGVADLGAKDLGVAGMGLEGADAAGAGGVPAAAAAPGGFGVPAVAGGPAIAGVGGFPGAAGAGAGGGGGGGGGGAAAVAGGLASVAGGGSTAAAGARAGVAAERELARLHPSWVRFAPFTLTGLVIVGVVIGTAGQVIDATHVNVTTIGSVHRLTVRFGNLQPAQQVLDGVLAVLVLLAVLSVAGYIALFWNFRLVRQGRDALRVSRGLLSTRTTTIDSRRLRGAELSEPLLLRAVGGARCLAITTGLHIGRGAERGGSLLLPPAPRGVVSEVAASVLGTSAEPLTGDLRRHGPAARRRRYVRALAGASVFIGAVLALWAFGHAPAWAWQASLVLLPLAALLAADRYRSLGHRLTGGWLVTRTGSLVRRRSVLSTSGIIGWRFHQSWFQRRQGLVSLAATTAAGRQRYVAHDIPVADALAIAASATGDLMTPFLH